uniref:Uncharacterized protein n=1 Tax=Romanomermis culicivorax TaxID=13658 RepID=A0A915HJK4_ROMCU
MLSRLPQLETMAGVRSIQLRNFLLDNIAKGMVKDKVLQKVIKMSRFWEIKSENKYSNRWAAVTYNDMGKDRDRCYWFICNDKLSKSIGDCSRQLPVWLPQSVTVS